MNPSDFKPEQMPTVSTELKRLEGFVDYCFGLAGQLLEKDDQFYPFGATMDIYGKMTAMNALMGEKNPKGVEVLLSTELILGLQLAKWEIIAFALLTTGTRPKPVLGRVVRIRLKCPYSSWEICTSYSMSNGTVKFAPYVATKARPPCGTMRLKGERLRAQLAEILGRK